eukprot:gene4498-6355_t
MQSLKWRLSFQSSRPPLIKQLKRLWTDCEIIFKSTSDFELSKIKVLLIFLDAILSCADQQNQSLMLEELESSLLEIFKLLLENIKILSAVLREKVWTVDDNIMLNEALVKSLSSTELLISTNNLNIEKNILKTKLEYDSGVVRSVLDAIVEVSNMAQQLTMIRVLKSVIFTNDHLLEFINHKGFDKLSQIAKISKESPIVSQVMVIFKQYFEYSQTQAPLNHNIAVSTQEKISIANNNNNSSVHLLPFHGWQSPHQLSAPINVSSNHNIYSMPIHANYMDLHNESNIQQDSLTSKGLNLAFNVVNELIKLTPLASNWLAPEYMNGPKDRDTNSSLLMSQQLEEMNYIYSIIIPEYEFIKELHRIQMIANNNKDDETSSCVLSTSNNSENRMDGESMNTIPIRKRRLSTKNANNNENMIRLNSYLDENVVASIKKPIPTPSDSSGQHTTIIADFYFDLDSSDSNQGINHPITLVSLDENIFSQGMLDVLFLAMERATCPSDVMDVLHTLETIAIKNKTGEASFDRSDGYTKLSNMILQVEKNLHLLAPCRDFSIAAAIGNNSSSKSSSINHKSESSSSYSGAKALNSEMKRVKSLYHAVNGGEFDYYYSSLLASFLNISFDQIYYHHISSSQDPRLSTPPRFLPINATKMMNFLSQLLKSSCSSLIMVVVRCVYAILKSNPFNMIILEECELIGDLFQTLYVVIFNPYKLDDGFLLHHLDNINQRNDEYSSTSLNVLFIASDICLVLQVIAVISAKRDYSVSGMISYFLSEVLTSLTILNEAKVTPVESSTPISVSLSDPDIRKSDDDFYVINHLATCPIPHYSQSCTNCETELAIFECLNDGCISDNCFQLCKECDTVFHKSVVKRSHIRIPLLDNVGAQSRTPFNLDDFARKSSLALGSSNSFFSLSGCRRLVLGLINSRYLKTLNEITLRNKRSEDDKYHLRNYRLQFMYLQENCFCILLAGLRGILDDLKARALPLPVELYPNLILSVRMIGTITQSNTPKASQFIADLLDKGDESISFNGEYNQQSTTGNDKQQPPEQTHFSLRRITTTLLFHSFARFVVIDQPAKSIFFDTNNFLFSHHNDDDSLTNSANLISPQQQLHFLNSIKESNNHPAVLSRFKKRFIDLLLVTGIDGLLVHLLVDSSKNIGMTFIDKQFILWLLRELVVTSISLCHDIGTTRLLEWLKWLLMSDIQLNAKSSNQSSNNNNPLQNNKVEGIVHSKPIFSSNNEIIKHIPIKSPSISQTLRLMILQEVRLLLSGTEESLWISNDSSTNPDILSLIQLNGIGLKSKQSSNPSLSNNSRPISLERFKDDEKTFYSHSLSNRIQSSNAFTRRPQDHMYLYNSLMNGTKIKNMFVALGFVELIYDILFVRSTLSHVFTTVYGNKSSRYRSMTQPLSDMDKEEFWSAFVTFGQLIGGCDRAKQTIDGHIGLPKLMDKLWILHAASANFNLIDDKNDTELININYQKILTTVMIELCVCKGRFMSQEKPYMFISSNFPTRQSMATGDLNSANLPKTSNPTDRSSDSNKSDRSVEESYRDGILAQLFTRNISTTTHQSDHSSMSNTKLSLLSPVFFYYEVAGKLIASTLHSLPLALTTNSYRGLFVQPGLPASNMVSKSSFNQLVRSRSGSGSNSILNGGKSSAGSWWAKNNANINNNSQKSLSNMNMLEVPDLSRDYISYNSATSTVNNLVSRKMIRNTTSIASLQSYENDTKWEVESNSIASSMHGGDMLSRLSMNNSSHSVIALSHALKSTANASTPPINTTTPSVNGDYYSKQNYNTDRSSLERTPVDKFTRNAYIKSKTVYPFPPMTLENSYPLVYFPLLYPLSKGYSKFNPSSLLILLHHSLLIRSGYSKDLIEDHNSFEVGGGVYLDYKDEEIIGESTHTNDHIDISASYRSNRNSEFSEHVDNHDALQSKANLPPNINTSFTNAQEKFISFRSILRKHLAFLLPPEHHKGHQSFGQSYCFKSQPAFSTLQLRSNECGATLLSLALLSQQDTQAFILSTLSFMLDGNPYNAHKFIDENAKSVLALVKVVHYLPEGAREAVGYIISQILRYSVDPLVLSELIKRLTSDKDNNKLYETEGNESAFDSNLLFIIGRAAERNSPQSFFHLSQNNNNRIRSRIELPPISSPLPNEALTIMSWIRFGLFDENPTSTLFQIFLNDHKIAKKVNLTESNGEETDDLIDIYFRVVYKTGNIHIKDLDTGSVASGMSNFGENSDGPKKLIQLCMSFGKKLRETHFIKQSSGVVNSNNSEFISKYESNAAAVRSHWQLALHQFLGDKTCKVVANDNCDSANSSSKHSAAEHDELQKQVKTLEESLSLITASVTRYSVPDVIVELDWAELGDWHLLAIGFDRQNGVSCYIDGVLQPLLLWTPLGYQYDPITQNNRNKQAITIENSSPIDHQKDQVNKISMSEFIKNNFARFVFKSVNKQSPLRVSLGGVKYEVDAIECLKTHIISYHDRLFDYKAEEEDCLKLEERLSDCIGVLRTHQSLIGTFNGTIGEISIFERMPSVDEIVSCYRGGPSNGLKFIKTNCLSSSCPNYIISRDMLSNSSYGENKSLSQVGQSNSSSLLSSSPPITLSFSTLRPISPPLVHTVNDKAYSEVHSTPKSNIYGNIYLKKGEKIDTKLKLRMEQLPDFMTDDIQIHHTNSIDHSVHALGGCKILFPLLTKDKARMIAALRIIACMIISSSESDAEFRASHVDKVILHVSREYPDLISLETLQILFDLVMNENSFASTQNNSFLAPNVIANNNSGLNANSNEYVRRVAVLELLIDMTLTCHSNLQITRSAVEWLREVCDELLENCQVVLKSGTLIPLLAALSLWEINTDIINAMESMNQNDKINGLVYRKNGENSFNKPIKNPTEGNSTNKTSELHSRFNSIDSDLSLQVTCIEKYKLQQSCARFLRQLLICNISDPALQNNINQANLGQSPTGFNYTHIAALLNFTLALSRIGSQRSAAKNDTKPKINAKFNRNLFLRIKQNLQSTYTGVSILKGFDLCDDRYWIFSAAVVPLDCILETASNGRSAEYLIINMLRLSFQGNGLWYLLLELMGSKCLELRDRALRILALSLSTLDGKLDNKQLANFDKYHGFQIMAEQLSIHSDCCSETIVTAVMGLMFWNYNQHRQHNLIIDKNAAAKESSTTADSSPYNAKIRSNSLSTENSPNKTSKVANSEDMSISQSSTANNGILSIFNWGNARVPSTSISGNYSSDFGLGPTTAVSPMNRFDGTGKIEDTNVSEVIHSINAAIPSMFPDMTFHKSPNEDSIVSDRKNQLGTDQMSLELSTQSDNNSKIPNNQSYPPRPTISTSQIIHNNEPSMVHSSINSNPSHPSGISNQQEFPFIIHIPQIIEVLWRLMIKCNSSSLCQHVFSTIEKCVSPSKDSKADISNSNGIQRNNKSNSNVSDLNLEAIFGQKDWLLWLADLLIQFRNRILYERNANNDGEGGEVNRTASISQSENDSVNDYNSGNEDSASINNVSSIDSSDHSDGKGSIYGNTYGDYSASHPIHQQQQFHAFSQPIISFINQLLMLDMRSKSSTSYRKWNELFRLSVPELSEIQELILVNLLHSLQSLSVMDIFDNNTESILNFLRHMSSLLDMALEKIDITLSFTQYVLSSIYILSYRCPLEIRSRIKETLLFDVRKNYVIRLLILYWSSSSLKVTNNSMSPSATSSSAIKIQVVLDIASSLQNYLQSSEGGSNSSSSSVQSKIISDTHVMMTVLTMFVEAFDDLDFLFENIDNMQKQQSDGDDDGVDDERSSFINQSSFINLNLNNQESVVMHIHKTLATIQNVILLIQSCVNASPECKKFVRKQCSELEHDPNMFMMRAFCNNFYHQDKPSAAVTSAVPVHSNSEVEAASNDSISQNNYKQNSINSSTGVSSLRDVDSQAVSSSSWWGVWSSNSNGISQINNSNNNNSNNRSSDQIVRIASDDFERNKKSDPSDGKLKSTLSDENMIDDNKGADVSSGPNDISSFLDWYCALDQRPLQLEWRRKMTHEAKSVIRHVEKLREKCSQRYIKHTRTLQDKRLKEVQLINRTNKESINAMKSGCDKIHNQNIKERTAWLMNVSDKITLGGNIMREAENNNNTKSIIISQPVLTKSLHRSSSLSENRFNGSNSVDYANAHEESNQLKSLFDVNNDNNAGSPLTHPSIQQSQESLQFLLKYFENFR